MTFKPGNKLGKGRPAGAIRGGFDFKAACQLKGQKVFDAMVSIALSEQLEPNERVALLKYIADQGYGKPRESVDIDNSGEVNLNVNLTTKS